MSQLLKEIENVITSNSNIELIDFDGQTFEVKCNASGSRFFVNEYSSKFIRTNGNNIKITSNDLQLVQPHIGLQNEKLITLEQLNQVINWMCKF